MALPTGARSKRAKKKRTCYPTAVAKCTVSYRDNGGVEHAVELTADSLYEAAALGLEALTAAKLTESRPGLATMLEVTVHPPSVVHRVRVQQLKEWLNGATASPREIILKKRLKEKLGK